jgi:Raf kinase inhibitor-like YbhB/YbcL family protein
MASMWKLVFLSLFLVVAVGCDEEEKPPLFDVVSPAFKNGATIPSRHTGASGISPPLMFHGLADGTKSLAIIMEDPDATLGTVLHWLIWDITNFTNIKEGIADEPPAGVKQGINATDEVGYFPPSPPKNQEHRYYFKVYALDMVLELEEASTRTQLTDAMEGHVVGYGELHGLSAD